MLLVLASIDLIDNTATLHAGVYVGQGPGAAGDGAGGPAAPLEELGPTRHRHLARDRRIRAHHLRRTTRTHAYHLPGPSQGTVLYTPFVNFSEYN